MSQIRYRSLHIVFQFWHTLYSIHWLNLGIVVSAGAACHNVCYIYTNTQCRQHERSAARKHWDQVRGCVGSTHSQWPWHVLDRGVRVTTKATRFPQFMFLQMSWNFLKILTNLFRNPHPKGHILCETKVACFSSSVAKCASVSHPNKSICRNICPALLALTLKLAFCP